MHYRCSQIEVSYTESISLPFTSDVIKYFDTVTHSDLSIETSKYGIRGTILALLNVGNTSNIFC